MKVAVLVCFFVAVYARIAVQPIGMKVWQEFKEKHGKSYKNTDEEYYRLKVFTENQKKIEEHNERFNQGKITYKMAVNKFADLTHKEFLERYTTLKMTAKQYPNNVFSEEDINEAMPASIDWRKKGAVTKVKDQKDCGSCWAFSTTGSIEGQHKKISGKLVSLSEQQLVDCSPQNQGCYGGYMDWAFQYVINNSGIDTEASYKYTAMDGSCVSTSGKIGAKISNYTDILSGSESALTAAIATVGPISVAIDASSSSFMFYSEGVYYDTECSDVFLDHGVLAVGYGSKDISDYYIVKNSWGKDWGDKGYILMSRNRDNNCGIATVASFPNV